MNGKPVFGTIPYFAGEYSVEFEPEGSTSRHTARGYGPFPFDRYNIPVIDLTGDKRVSEFLEREFKEIDNDTFTPKRILEIAREMNLKIIEPTTTN
jgi:hypothetical protein